MGQKRAAASMAVGVGSFRDTREMQGMAHFVEHMLFMGSEKFPGENDFDEFVSTHGGFDNAYTDMEETVFAFDIVQEHFDKGLDFIIEFSSFIFNSIPSVLFHSWPSLIFISFL